MKGRQLFTDSEYETFVGKLREEMAARELSTAKAAQVLGITRQALHGHVRLDGKQKHQPNWRLVRRAVRAWDLEITVQGRKFDRHAFGAENTAHDHAVQLMLTEALDRVDNGNLEINIL